MGGSGLTHGYWHRTRIARLLATAGVLLALGLPVSAAAASTGYTVSLIPGGKFLEATAVDPATDTIYLVTPQTRQMTVIDGATSTVTATVTLGSFAEGVAVDPATDTIYVSELSSSSGPAAVEVVNGVTNATTATIPVPAGSSLRGIAVDSATDTVYVANPGAGGVTAINGVTNSVTASISTATGTVPIMVAIDESTDVAWVTNDAGTVIAMNLATNSVIGSVSLGTSEPISVAVDSATNTVYATDIENNDVVVINGATRTITAVVPTGEDLFGVGVDPLTDTIYASSYGPPLGTTWVIDGASNTVTDTLARGGLGVAVDPTTGIAYEAAFNLQPGAWVIAPSATDALSPVITSDASATFTTGQDGRFTAQANALPAASFTESGALPDGVTLSPDGKLAGTPAPDSGGSYPITLTASNGTAPDFHQAFTLLVNEAPAATVASTATFQVGTPVNFPIQVTGDPAPSVQVMGDLPAGVSLTGNSLSGWQLTGTPARGSGGLYSVSILVSNSAGSVDPPVTLTVQEAPSITSAPKATFRTGTDRSFSLTYLGFPAPTFTETGKLPAGVSFSSGGGFSGTPGRHAGGVYSITITGSNGIAPDATQPFALTVNQPPAFTSARQATFSAGKRHTFTVRTSGYPAAKLSERGALPKGITS
jgi:YVTN family beta-propeller protein